MILDCPTCGAALMYDPETGKMKCESCNNLYETYELSTDYVRRGEKEVDEYAATSETTSDVMDFNIYSCTACGAEIMVNDVEVSTFCSYCGQPTLIFSRIESRRKPRYILPFTVTKEKAVSLIKEQFDNGYFVPDDIRNVKMERVRGIYIPYWLYDIHYEDLEILQGTVGSGKNASTYFYSRKAECDFEHLAIEASKQLNDTISRKLNPYHTAYMKDFSIEYLSGFYADHYSVKTDKLKGQAIMRAQSTFENEIKRSIPAHDVRVLKKKPTFEITNEEYALFPAWFLTFRNNNRPYTLLVNGQTEKVIGSVPYDRKKAIGTFLILGILISIIIWCFFYPLLLSVKPVFLFPFVWFAFLAVTPLYYGINNLKDVRMSRQLSGLSETDLYVKNRQGDD